MATSQPRLASSTAMPRPIPLLAPVTKAVFPSKLSDMTTTSQNHSSLAKCCRDRLLRQVQCLSSGARPKQSMIPLQEQAWRLVSRGSESVRKLEKVDRSTAVGLRFRPELKL